MKEGINEGRNAVGVQFDIGSSKKLLRQANEHLYERIYSIHQVYTCTYSTVYTLRIAVYTVRTNQRSQWPPTSRGGKRMDGWATLLFIISYYYFQKILIRKLRICRIRSVVRIVGLPLNTQSRHSSVLDVNLIQFNSIQFNSIHVTPRY